MYTHKSKTTYFSSHKRAGRNPREVIRLWDKLTAIYLGGEACVSQLLSWLFATHQAWRLLNTTNNNKICINCCSWISSRFYFHSINFQSTKNNFPGKCWGHFHTHQSSIGHHHVISIILVMWPTQTTCESRVRGVQVDVGTVLPVKGHR